jgi:Ca2+-binding EF-hand superfamily protein
MDSLRKRPELKEVYDEFKSRKNGYINKEELQSFLLNIQGE